MELIRIAAELANKVEWMDALYCRKVYSRLRLGERYIQRERSLSAQAHGSERLSLRLRVPIQAPELSKITYKQELILDTRAGPDWQLWQMFLFKSTLNQSNFHIVFGRRKPGLLGFLFIIPRVQLIIIFRPEPIFLADFHS